MIPGPKWAAFLFENMSAIGIGAALAMPVIRWVALRTRGCLASPNVKTIAFDLSSGFALPSFFMLTITPFVPQAIRYADAQSVWLAGALGILYTLGEVLGAGRPQSG